MDPNLQAMYEHFHRIWSVDPMTADVEVRYQNKTYLTDPDREKYWCRVSTIILDSDQATFSTSVGQVGHKRYETKGNIYVQIFGPRHLPESWNTCQALAKLAQKAFRSYVQNGPVTYKDVTYTNNTPEENWVYFSVRARFTYDDFC